ncbi:hypothetical protein ACFXKW_05140, partial [Streptomyces sp. NPDC059193]|uniref:hypothetical protein n=1 Tax=Streptomyces sp. NPDC059193 TaxID=3346763 RepID=UPI0036BC809B
RPERLVAGGFVRGWRLRVRPRDLAHRDTICGGGAARAPPFGVAWLDPAGIEQYVWFYFVGSIMATT